MAARIVVRQAHDEDTESVGRFLVGLSRGSRQQRFFNSLRYVSPELIRSLVATTSSQLVLLALHGNTVVGHVMAGCVAEHTAEVGIVVADAYQHQGVGHRLLNELTDTLAGVGVTKLRCDVLSENDFVLDWLRRSLTDIRFERDGPTMTVHGRLNADDT
jgi:GNAT superfamily N-acetyltransferase